MFPRLRVRLGFNITSTQLSITTDQINSNMSDQKSSSGPTTPDKTVQKDGVDAVDLVENAVPENSSRAPTLIRNLTPEERRKLEKSLMRKIDLRLLPMIIIMYILNFLDRNNIAAARLAGIEKDLKLTGSQFQVFSRPKKMTTQIC